MIVYPCAFMCLCRVGFAVEGIEPWPQGLMYDRQVLSQRVVFLDLPAAFSKQMYMLINLYNERFYAPFISQILCLSFSPEDLISHNYSVECIEAVSF